MKPEECKEFLVYGIDYAQVRIAELTRERDELRAKLAEAEKQVVGWYDAAIANGKRAVAAEAKLAEARADVAQALADRRMIAEKLAEANARVEAFRIREELGVQALEAASEMRSLKSRAEAAERRVAEMEDEVRREHRAQDPFGI
jgi:chromosome segregation ATPase